MIEQYLSNTNEIATVLILPKILELNKALFGWRLCSRSYHPLIRLSHEPQQLMTPAVQLV